MKKNNADNQAQPTKLMAIYHAHALDVWRFSNRSLWQINRAERNGDEYLHPLKSVDILKLITKEFFQFEFLLKLKNRSSV